MVEICSAIQGGKDMDTTMTDLSNEVLISTSSRVRIKGESLT